MDKNDCISKKYLIEHLSQIRSRAGGNLVVNVKDVLNTVIKYIENAPAVLEGEQNDK